MPTQEYPKPRSSSEYQSRRWEFRLLDTILVLADRFLMTSGLFNQYIPLDEVDSRGRFYNAADLTGLEGKGSILKLLLHLTMAKEATIQT
jgi:hypothetical protein